MSKLSAAIAANSTRPGGTCTFATLRLSEADQADLDAALANRSIPSTVIARGLTAIGHKIGDSTVQRHRKGDCGCPR